MAQVATALKVPLISPEFSSFAHASSYGFHSATAWSSLSAVNQRCSLLLSQKCQLCRRGRNFSAASKASDSKETVNFSMEFNSDLDLTEEEPVGDNVVAAPPPTFGRIDIVVDNDAIERLDLSAAHAVLAKYVKKSGEDASFPAADLKELFEQTIGFVLNYEREDQFDPRELSEMPDIRLWFVRLDATYPWLPIVLDWRSGELARYAAMLVPHQMSRRQGLVFNPEALELFAMRKLFLLYEWLQANGMPKPTTKLDAMLKMLGFSVTQELYSLLEQHPPP